MLGRVCAHRGGAICTSCKGGRCRRAPKKATAQRRLNHKVYGSRAHRAQRLRILARDDWTCVDCGRRDDTETGRGLVADHVAGIDELREFGDDELETRCTVCSGRKDGRRATRKETRAADQDA